MLCFPIRAEHSPRCVKTLDYFHVMPLNLHRYRTTQLSFFPNLISYVCAGVNAMIWPNALNVGFRGYVAKCLMCTINRALWFPNYFSQYPKEKSDICPGPKVKIADLQYKHATWHGTTCWVLVDLLILNCLIK